MDSVAQLALLTKAKLVFETPNTFLSFPTLTPLSYSPDELTFSSAPTAQQETRYGEFCRFANALPTGVVFQPSLDTLLWDMYQNIFTTAQLAQGSLTPQQAADLQAADAFLYTQTSDGLRTASAQFVAYNQYQQACMEATQNYKSQQLTAQASPDPNVQSQWQNTLGPQLRAAVQSAESDWEQLGFKVQVEQALMVEQNCAALSPHQRWQTWAALLNRDLDLMTDPVTNVPFGPTAFSPSNILGQTSWPTFTLSAPEIAQLVSQAPSELSNILNTAAGASNIQSLSFEYCSVALSRSWFAPDVFSARFWRFSDPSMQLSDGGNPPQGQWPAYITGAVLARNIVEQQAAPGASQPPPQPVRAFPPIALRSTFVLPQPPRRIFPLVSPRPPADPSAVLQNRQIAMAKLNAATFQAPSTFRPISAIARPAPAFLAHTAAATSAASRFTVAGTVKAVEPLPTAVSQPATPPPALVSDPNISILAFLCKRLPKSPDPDPSFAW